MEIDGGPVRTDRPTIVPRLGETYTYERNVGAGGDRRNMLQKYAIVDMGLHRS
jgi:hypothetical protein